MNFEAELQYNLGKRGRHANNYGMRAKRFSEILPLMVTAFHHQPVR